MGVDSVPFCSWRVFCVAVNWIVGCLASLPLVQQNIGPAGYFHDAGNEFNYRRTFLARMNNEGGVVEERKAERMKQLDGLMLIKFSKDTVVHPRESQWFGYVDANGEAVGFEDTEVYRLDLIGLRKLHEEGKVRFVDIARDHLRISKHEFSEHVIPFIAH